MKIDWLSAKKDYLLNSKLSYADVAKKYGVSKLSVNKMAQKEKWQDARKKTLTKVNQELAENIGNKLAEVKVRHANLGKLLQEKGLNKIKKGKSIPKNFDDARKAIDTGVKIERDALDLDKPAIPTINIQNIVGAWVSGKENSNEA
jgi:uncharacterized protein YjcR